jgi:hypothetical protein
MTNRADQADPGEADVGLETVLVPSELVPAVREMIAARTRADGVDEARLAAFIRAWRHRVYGEPLEDDPHAAEPTVAEKAEVAARIAAEDDRIRHEAHTDFLNAFAKVLDRYGPMSAVIAAHGRGEPSTRKEDRADLVDAIRQDLFGVENTLAFNWDRILGSEAPAGDDADDETGVHADDPDDAAASADDERARARRARYDAVVARVRASLTERLDADDLAQAMETPEDRETLAGLREAIAELEPWIVPAERSFLRNIRLPPMALPMSSLEALRLDRDGGATPESDRSEEPPDIDARAQTAEILADEKTMAGRRLGIAQAEAGKVIPLEIVRRHLGLGARTPEEKARDDRYWAAKPRGGGSLSADRVGGIGTPFVSVSRTNAGGRILICTDQTDQTTYIFLSRADAKKLRRWLRPSPLRAAKPETAKSGEPARGDRGDETMKHSDFTLGCEFMTGSGRWRCTDVGTRTVAAIRLNLDGDPRWYNGPPYAVAEQSLDEYDFGGCRSAPAERGDDGSGSKDIVHHVVNRDGPPRGEKPGEKQNQTEGDALAAGEAVAEGEATSAGVTAMDAPTDRVPAVRKLGQRATKRMHMEFPDFRSAQDDHALTDGPPMQLAEILADEETILSGGGVPPEIVRRHLGIGARTLEERERDDRFWAAGPRPREVRSLTPECVGATCPPCWNPLARN